MDKNDFLKKLLMNSDEIEAYSEPSIMDEYIRKEDPEQYEKIQRAKLINQYIDMGSQIGGPMGMVGALKGGGSKMLKKMAPIRKSLEETTQQLPKDIREKAFQTLNPEVENVGKVIKKEIPEENLGKVEGDIIPEKEKTIEERLTEIQRRLDEDPKLSRLKEYLKSKKEGKTE